MHTPLIDLIVSIIIQWLLTQPDVRAVALVGSYARGTARPDSDVDIMILSVTPECFRDLEWLAEIDWAEVGVSVGTWHDADYGAVWSRHVALSSGLVIEFSFGALSWAAVEPVDAGTARVMGNGHRILYDPDGLLARVLQELQDVPPSRNGE
jgi:hypothetical protein